MIARMTLWNQPSVREVVQVVCLKRRRGPRGLVCHRRVILLAQLALEGAYGRAFIADRRGQVTSPFRKSVCSSMFPLWFLGLLDSKVAGCCSRLVCLGTDMARIFRLASLFYLCPWHVWRCRAAQVDQRPDALSKSARADPPTMVFPGPPLTQVWT